jgi:plastocyanin
MALRRTILLAALVTAVACSDDDGDGGQGPETPEGDILVRNNSFDPAALTVQTGATVVWAWVAGAVTHNVTFADDVASGDRSSGTFERTFAAPGNYPYLCTIHGAAMSGTITVEDATGGSTRGY